MSATTILLYGSSGSGKSANIGILAEEVFTTTGLKTRVYTADLGGTDVLTPYQELDIIEIEELGQSDIWIWVNKAVRGQVKGKDGKWVLDKERNAKVGMYAFESAHGIAQLLQMDMEAKAGTGTAIGGDANTSFSVSGDGETLKIGGQKGYGKFAVPQSQVLKAIYDSFKLPAQYIVWTAGLSVDKDEATTSRIIGPDVIGRVLTATLPKDFNYCFRLSVNPAQGGKPEEHVLYLGTHIDTQAGGAAAMGNTRRPLDAPEIKEQFVKPANLVKALRLIREDAREAAKQAITKRLAAAKKG